MAARKKPELLIPASSLEVLKTAVVFGADAVYIGGEAFGLRAKAKNFSMEDMREGIAFAHEHDVKVYVTANILAHNKDLDGVRKYFEELKEIRPDGLQRKCVRRLNGISARRQIIQTTAHIISGIARGQAGLYQRENYRWKKSKNFVQTFRKIWRLRRLSMVRCVFLTQDAVF